jgi:DNA-binding CsgD family transcriptional regulator
MGIGTTAGSSTWFEVTIRQRNGHWSKCPFLTDVYVHVHEQVYVDGWAPRTRGKVGPSRARMRTRARAGSFSHAFCLGRLTSPFAFSTSNFPVAALLTNASRTTSGAVSRTPTGLAGEAAVDIVLTSSQQQRFATALRALLSPLAYPSSVDWRSAVNRSLEQLLEADHITFGIPGGEPDFVSSGHDARGASAAMLESRVRRFGIGERALELGAFNRELLLGVRLPANHDSEYSHDYIVVNQEFDWLALVAAMTPDRATTRVAQIVLHSDPSAGRAFASRGLTLARLLFPAFRTGILTHCRMAEERRFLGGVMDHLSEGVLTCDARGRVVQQSAVLSAMLDNDGERATLLETMHAVARTVAAQIGASARRDEADVIENVRTDHAWYRVRGTIVGEGVVSPVFRILVALQRLSPALPAEAAVRERFGLTPKEARVCLLLARGMTNEEIAAALCVSRYTARRHTEKVLLKLQVKSRAEVGPTLLEFSAVRTTGAPAGGPW